MFSLFYNEFLLDNRLIQINIQPEIVCNLQQKVKHTQTELVL